MHSTEPHISGDSQYFIHLPSTAAKRVYLYPVVLGIFRYEPAYYLRRSHYDNYLLMYINRGTLTLVYEGRQSLVREGQVVLLDCHRPHEYGNPGPGTLEIYWLHFQGSLAPEFYALITESGGSIHTPLNPYPFTHHLRRLYELYRTSAPIQEAELSRRITTMLSELIGARAGQNNSENAASEIAENGMAYINEHFREDISLEMIAENAALSPYYFTRIFSQETGFTPHQYLIATRLSFAKYLLQSGEMSVKEIAFHSGFHSESSFCATFRKWEGITPGAYRSKIRH